jgi:hypothetical protein
MSDAETLPQGGFSVLEDLHRLDLGVDDMLERVAGIAATAARKWDAAEAHFLLALGQFDEMPHQFERLETRRFYAQMLAERAGPGDLDRARRFLEEAGEGYTHLRMPRHGEMAKKALATLGS